ncbi:MAG: M20/M25/M40 family metallo-hydrolase [Clostridia bacterium]|nr:M20/M25/M40 family metallo-hydrolase [Clostridia bacterium]
MITLILIICLIRALRFKPEAKVEKVIEPVEFDKEKAVRDLREMVTCKTISYNDFALEDDAEFQKFESKLAEMFPAVHAACKKENVGRRGIVFCWKGEDSSKATVLMSHFDVVEVDESGWDKAPFDGIIEGETLWGRGTLDTKSTLNGCMQAAEQLIKEGYVPRNDIYLCFAGDEEISGPTCPAIVDWFEKNGTNVQLVVDEGGAVVEKVFPGVKDRVAVIGIAEKGMLNLAYTVKSKGGHASAPPARTPIGILSKACCKLEAKPFKANFTAPALALFDTLGRRSTFVYRLIFANMWLFKPVLALIGKMGGGEINALMRTTCAFTQMKGSNGRNVLPAQAEMLSNFRIMTGETIESTVEYVKKVIDDDRVELTVVSGNNPSVVSRTDCEEFEIVKAAVGETFPDAVVTPYLMFACSDSQHYGRISDKVYRFSAQSMSSDERKTIHGHNERITFKGIYECVEFYLRLIKRC